MKKPTEKQIETAIEVLQRARFHGCGQARILHCWQCLGHGEFCGGMMVVAATSKEEAIVIANALPKQTFVVLYTEAVELDSIVPLDASPTIITRYETGE